MLELLAVRVSGGVSRRELSPAVPTSSPRSRHRRRRRQPARSCRRRAAARAPRTFGSRAGDRRAAARRTPRAARRRSSSQTATPPRTRRDCRRTCSRGRRARMLRPRVRDEQAADRQPVRQALRERHRVGPHAELLEREERARAADARLHLVEDEQRAGVVGERRARLRRTARRGDDPALAEHRLEQDAAGLVGDRRLERADVVRLRERDAGEQRLERRRASQADP